VLGHLGMILKILKILFSDCRVQLNVGKSGLGVAGYGFDWFREAKECLVSISDSCFSSCEILWAGGEAGGGGQL